LTEATIHRQPASCGCLIINADDWGRDDRTTTRNLECFRRRVLSSASGMVFMEDSERAANIAQDQGLDIGPTTWEILRTAYQMSNGPFVPGGLLAGCGLRPVLSLAERHCLQRRNYTQLPPEGKVNSCVE
jgi:hypothetical protein